MANSGNNNAERLWFLKHAQAQNIDISKVFAQNCVPSRFLMENSENNNAEQRLWFLKHAQAQNIDTSKVFAQNCVQSRFLMPNANEENMNIFSQQIQQYLAQNGTENFDKWIKDMMEEGCKKPLLIAVTGETGVGKSTFINTIRHLPHNDPDAAKTDSLEECTMEVQEYSDPKNPSLVYYDLPGIGSVNFPRDEYLTKIPPDRYDFFIILSRNRFTDNDCYLGKELDRLGKKFYFVRTRIDEDLQNFLKKGGDPSHQSEYVNKAKTVSEKSLKQYASDHPVFIISGELECYGKWDFPKLIQALIDDAPDIKKEIIIRTITANSHEVVDRKAAFLEQRIFLAALAAAVIGAAPVFGLSIACDTIIISREVHQYLKDFGLDEESMENLAKTCGKDRAHLEKIIFGASSVIQGNCKSAIETVVKVTLSKTILISSVAGCAQIAPIFGQVISSAASLLTVESALQTLLAEIKFLALKRVDLLLQLSE